MYNYFVSFVKDGKFDNKIFQLEEEITPTNIGYIIPLMEEKVEGIIVFYQFVGKDEITVES